MKTVLKRFAGTQDSWEGGYPNRDPYLRYGEPSPKLSRIPIQAKKTASIYLVLTLY